MKKLSAKILTIFTCAALLTGSLAFTCGCDGQTAASVAGQVAVGVINGLFEEDGEETTAEKQTKPEKETKAEKETSAAEDSQYASGFDVHNIDIPEYNGKPLVKINGGKPFFTDDEITDEYFMELSEMDSLGRCGSNWMCADEPHITEGERDSISDIHPSGWHKGGFYQRSHLLMWKLSGCNDERNLITGTDTFNQETMREYEERVTAYLWKHEKNHVMYRVSPLFEGNDLVARGVLMEAYSVEDGGKGLQYCIFVYNAEPDYIIDYATGDYEKY